MSIASAQKLQCFIANAYDVFWKQTKNLLCMWLFMEIFAEDLITKVSQKFCIILVTCKFPE